LVFELMTLGPETQSLGLGLEHLSLETSVRGASKMYLVDKA